MGRKKLERIISNKTRTNLFQMTHPQFLKMKGQWVSSYFGNQNPIVLELGCGKGEYTVGMAQLFPEKNFIGIDIKGDRLAAGSDQAINEGLTNIAFLRTNILELSDFFGKNEISEIWITFPDPRTRLRDTKRRLTYERFLNIYQQFLQPNSFLYLKTDNLPFFEFSLESLTEFGIKNIAYTYDLYQSDLLAESLNIKTRFEEIFTGKGFKINFLKCVMNEAL
jgi:tRNA (guanine-N7-)-methyltransferase